MRLRHVLLGHWLHLSTAARAAAVTLHAAKRYPLPSRRRAAPAAPRAALRPAAQPAAAAALRDG